MKDDCIELPGYKTKPTMVGFQGILGHKSTTGTRLTKFTTCVWGLNRHPGMEKVSDHGTNWSQKKI